MVEDITISPGVIFSQGVFFEEPTAKAPHCGGSGLIPSSRTPSVPHSGGWFCVGFVLMNEFTLDFNFSAH